MGASRLLAVTFDPLAVTDVTGLENQSDIAQTRVGGRLDFDRQTFLRGIDCIAAIAKFYNELQENQILDAFQTQYRGLYGLLTGGLV